MKHLILLFIIIFYFNKIIYSQEQGIIKGKIIDSTSMKPIEFCAITIESKVGIKKSKYTDISGDYEFNNLPIGKYCLYYSYRKQRNVLFGSIGVNKKVNNVSVFSLKLLEQDTVRIQLIDDCNPGFNHFEFYKIQPVQIKYETNLMLELENRFKETNKCLFDGYFVSTKTHKKTFVFPLINRK